MGGDLIFDVSPPVLEVADTLQRAMEKGGRPALINPRSLPSMAAAAAVDVVLRPPS